VNVGLRPTPRQRVLLAASVVAVAAAVVAFVLAHGYTPTTTAYVRNDSSKAVTLDNCTDTAVTVAPRTTQQIQPFEDAAHAACTVYLGNSDLGRPIGCVKPLSSGGRTVTDATVRVSAVTTCTFKSFGRSTLTRSAPERSASVAVRSAYALSARGPER
jgi:hypothetical protein